MAYHEPRDVIAARVPMAHRRGSRDGGEAALRIVMLSDNEGHGGAAIAASRLAGALADTGHEAIRVVGLADGLAHPWRTAVLDLRLWQKSAVVAMRRLSRAAGMRLEHRLIGVRLARLLRELEPDLVNVHNLHAAGWGPGLALACRRAAPSVWTLHDMWSFTGRCTYAYDCTLFTRGCDASCPTPAEYPALPPAQIAAAWRGRRALFAATAGLVAASPSRWLAEQAARGFWAGRRVEVIPNGVPLEAFFPLDRRAARAALGLPLEGPVVLLAAADLGERRKGAGLVGAALEATAAHAATVITVGAGELSALPARSISLGFMRDDRSLALAYAAADLLLHPAPVDNLPNTVVEAMACGTPTVAFAVGGLPELVRPGSTGWLARAGDPADLAAGLEAALDAIAAGDDRRAACRTVAVAEFDVRLQVRRYLALFGELTAGER